MQLEVIDHLLLKYCIRLNVEFTKHGVNNTQSFHPSWNFQNYKTENVKELN